MFKPFKRTFTPAGVPDTGIAPLTTQKYDIDHFASNVTGASWTLSNTFTTDGLAHKVSIRNDSATDHSAKVVTITGTYNGQTVSETIFLPGIGLTVQTAIFVDSIVSPLVPSATIGGDTMDIGIVAEFASVAYPSGSYYGNLNISTELSDNSGVNYAIDHTFSDVQTEPTADWIWLNNANDNISNSTTTDFGTMRPKAIRFRTNTYTTFSSSSFARLTVGQSYN